MTSMNRTFGAIFIIAGTTIGAGMLALPIKTGVCGFFPAMGLFASCFLFMLSCLFLLLEASFYVPPEKSNIISMADALLGPVWCYCAWIVFLLLLYAASAAYIAGASDYLHQWMQINSTLSMCLFVLIAGILFFRTACADWLNRIFMLLLIASYGILVFHIGTRIEQPKLFYGSFRYVISSLPIVILAFTSHIILPTIKSYLSNDVKQIKKSLFLGNLIPFICYVLWVALIIFLLPHHGSGSLLAIFFSKHPLISLSQALGGFGIHHIFLYNNLFSFSALVTSFLGVVLSLRDFLADGLHIDRKQFFVQVKLFFMIVLPPCLLVFFCPTLFIQALGYAGVFVAILYVLFPVVMVWRSRYHFHYSKPAYVWPGGKVSLIATFCVGLLIILAQLINTLHISLFHVT